MKLRDSSTETMVPLLTSDYRTAAAITDGSANGISFPTGFRSSLRFWYTRLRHLAHSSTVTNSEQGQPCGLVLVWVAVLSNVTMAHDQHISLPKTFSSGDVNEWFKRFDICSKTSGWNGVTKAKKFPMLLEGEVLAVCSIQEYMVGSKYSHYTVMFTHNFLDLLWANKLDEQLRTSENNIGRCFGAYILSIW